MESRLKKFFEGDGVWLVLILALVFFMRLPYAADTVIDWDESIYFVIAQDVVHGGSLYVTSWESKGPLLFFVFTPVIKLFGNSIVALRIFTTLYLLASMFFVYLTARELFGRGVSLIAPLVYGLFFMKFGGLSSNGELFMMLPAIIAAYCFVRYSKQAQGNFLLFLCGFFSAAAVLVKSTAFFTIILFPIALVVKKILPEYRWGKFLNDLSWYAVGGVLSSLFVLSYFLFHNSVNELFFVLFTYAQKYVGLASAQTGFDRLVWFVKGTLKNDLITMAAFAGLLVSIPFKAEKNDRNNFFFLTALIVLSFVGVYWPRNMYDHYYLQMGLAFALIVAFAVSRMKLDFKSLCPRNFAIFGITFVVIFSYGLMSGFLPDLKSYKDDETYKMSNFIKERTSESDKILVIGGQPIVYFLADRKSFTRFVFWLHLKAPYADIIGSESEIMSDLHRDKPKYIVYDKSRGYEVDFLQDFIKNNYFNEAEFVQANSIVMRLNETSVG